MKYLSKFVAITILLIMLFSIVSPITTGIAHAKSDEILAYNEYPQYFDANPSYSKYMSGFPANISGVDVSDINSNKYWFLDDDGKNTPTGSCKAVISGERSGAELTPKMHIFKVISSSLSGGTYDFEDISVVNDASSTSGSSIFIGDIGDNAPSDNSKRAIYYFDEPTVANEATSCANGMNSKYFVYNYYNPANPSVPLTLDTEAMFVHPETLDIYIVAKTNPTYSARRLFKITRAEYLSKTYNTSTTPGTLVSANAHLVGHLYMPSSEERSLKQVTAADMNSTGDFLVVSTYNEAYIWNLQDGRTLEQITVPAGSTTATFNTVMPLTWVVGTDVIESISFNADTSKLVIAEEHNGTGTKMYREYDLVNQAPVANPDNYALNAGQSVTFNPLANDADPDSDPIQVVDIEQPVVGTLINNNNGTFTYTAPIGFNGEVELNYTVGDYHGLAMGYSDYYYFVDSTIKFTFDTDANLSIRPLNMVRYDKINYGKTYSRQFTIKNESGDTITNPTVTINWLNKDYLENIQYRYGNGTFTALSSDTITLNGIALSEGTSVYFELKYTVKEPVNTLYENQLGDRFIPVNHEFIVGGNYNETQNGNNDYAWNLFLDTAN